MDAFAQRWNAAGGVGGEVPDGNYDVEITDAAALNRRSDGAPLVKLTLQVRSGEQQGRTFDHWLKLFEGWLAEAKDTLTLYGLDHGEIESWEEFQRAVGQLVGVTASVALGHNRNGYAEVNVFSAQLPLTAQQRPAPTSPPLPSASAAPVSAHEDIPFLHDGFPSYDERRSR
jgi:hypothetical protein